MNEVSPGQAWSFALGSTTLWLIFGPPYTPAHVLRDDALLRCALMAELVKGLTL